MGNQFHFSSQCCQNVLFSDAISECPHVSVEEVDDGSIPTVPQIVEPPESNGVTLTVPVPVIAIQRSV